MGSLSQHYGIKKCVSGGFNKLRDQYGLYQLGKPPNQSKCMMCMAVFAGQAPAQVGAAHQDVQQGFAGGHAPQQPLVTRSKAHLVNDSNKQKIATFWCLLDVKRDGVLSQADYAQS
jgi:hypothetical protein